ncbi:MAG TPA: bifunctional glycosyltransferase/class I SAM-dependent methyltransferase [Polyangiaceae bacterium]|jgi:2-polyprenyl-3-methyl-5-hydroxy-6-metoxy-1,4-benzoquinol methylase|nr:bifunctional glycosyltransferase/class I SAM-dependent methyltransferase [Polyangiaceae bacterium]
MDLTSQPQANETLNGHYSSRVEEGYARDATPDSHVDAPSNGNTNGHGMNGTATAELVNTDSPARASGADVAPARLKIAIFIVSYNAASTLSWVLDRIPESVWEDVEEVFVFDDSSKDDTYLLGLGYKVHHGRVKLSVFRNEKNLGYGGNQIKGYQYAIERGYDIVALLHGDGQYAPEALPALLEPLKRGEADAVFGSRMLETGGALKGGMPLYKYVGNKVLTTFENAALGMQLSEFHSGYRLYSCAALKQIPFERNTHDFHFDTQIIIQMHAAGMRIAELPIPTYYGDEICHVNGMKYAKDVFRSVLEFRAHELGLKHHPEYELKPRYKLKTSPLSSHAQLLNLVGPPSRRVLDLGSGEGHLSAALAKRGHHVVSVDLEPPVVPVPNFVLADLNGGLPVKAEEEFDVVLLADVLEHVPEPKAILRQVLDHLAPGGKIIISLPNAVHWSVRMQVAFGKFEYTNRGILDRGHLRFFTRASAERMFHEFGLTVRHRQIAPTPWENVVPPALSVVGAAIEKLDHALAQTAPNLFAYQNIFELHRINEAPMSQR